MTSPITSKCLVVAPIIFKHNAALFHKPEPELEVLFSVRRGEGFGCAVVRADVSLSPACTVVVSFVDIIINRPLACA